MGRVLYLIMSKKKEEQALQEKLQAEITRIKLPRGREVLGVLEQTPPELYADVVNDGIYLAGGGALMRGLDKRLTDKIGIQFHVAEDPLHAVARGTGISLKNADKFTFLMR